MMQDKLVVYLYQKENESVSMYQYVKKDFCKLKPKFVPSYNLLNIINMQELVNKLTNEVGLTAEQAAKTVATMVEHIKSKLPPSLAGNLDALLGNAQAQANEIGGSKPGDHLKEKAEDFAEAAKDKLEDLAEQAKDKLSDAADKAEEMAKDAFGKLKDMLGNKDK